MLRKVTKLAIFFAWCVLLSAGTANAQTTVILNQGNSCTDEIEPGITASRTINTLNPGHNCQGPLVGTGLLFSCGTCDVATFTDAVNKIGGKAPRFGGLQPLCGYTASIPSQIIENDDQICALSDNGTEYDIDLLSWESIDSGGCVDNGDGSCDAAGGTTSYVRTVVVAVAVATAQSILFGAAHEGGGPSILYTVDPTTGVPSVVGSIGFNRCSGMDFHPVTEILYATCERADGSDTHVLITIDPVTGAGTEVGPTGLESFKNSDTFGDCCDTATDISFRNSDNTLFAFTYDNFGLATVDNLAVGAMTEVGFDLGAVDSTVEGSGSAIAFSSGDVLFYADSGGLFTLDQAGSGTNSFTALSYPFTSPVSPRPNAMDFQPETGVLYASVVNGGGGRFIPSPRQNFLGVIDTGTGVVTIIGQTVVGLDALAWSLPVAELPFSDFSIRKAEIKFKMTSTINDRFKVRGELTLDALSNGIDPLNEKVMVTVGTSAITIPAGSFTEEGYEKFKFKGTINDAVVKMEIKQKAVDRFEFKVEAKWVDLTGTANPMDIGVAIGDDVGTATIDMEGELEFEAQREDEHKHKEKDRDKDDDDDDEKDD